MGNSMIEDLETNFQIVYMHPRNAKAIAINMSRFAVDMLMRTEFYQNLDFLKQTVLNMGNHTMGQKIEVAQRFGFSRLEDSFRISCCFENYIKAVLLVKDYVIHEIDRNLKEQLSKEQKKRPIHLNEFSNDLVLPNPEIREEDQNKRMQIKAIKRNTISVSVAMSKTYLQAIGGIDTKILELVKSYNNYRNNLHYYIYEKFDLKPTTYADFCALIDFVNSDIVPFCNHLVDELKLNESVKLKVLKYP